MILKLFAFPIFLTEHSWLMLLQKRVMHTGLDIYVLIGNLLTGSGYADLFVDVLFLYMDTICYICTKLLQQIISFIAMCIDSI